MWLHREITSSGTRWSCCKPMVFVTLGGCHLLDDLVACDSVEAREKIVQCPGGGFVRGLCSFHEDREEQLKLSMSLSYPHLQRRFLRCSTCGLGVWCQLASEPPSERSTQQGHSVLASTWTSGEKSTCQPGSSHWFASSLHKLVITFIYIVLV